MTTTMTAPRPTVEELNPYRIAQAQFDLAARYIPDLKRGLIEFLKRPARALTASGNSRLSTIIRNLKKPMKITRDMASLPPGFTGFIQTPRLAWMAQRPKSTMTMRKLIPITRIVHCRHLSPDEVPARPIE